MKRLVVVFFLFFSLSSLGASVLTDDGQPYNKGNLDKQAEYKRQFGSLDESTANLALAVIFTVLGLAIAGIVISKKKKSSKKKNIY